MLVVAGISRNLGLLSQSSAVHFPEPSFKEGTACLLFMGRVSVTEQRFEEARGPSRHEIECPLDVGLPFLHRLHI